MIVATGPLTSPALAEAILALTGEGALAFFDAIAPIVHADSIDMSDGLAPVALRQGRARAATRRAYINCPMDQAQYDAFIDALLAGAEDRVQGLGEACPISTAACRSR